MKKEAIQQLTAWMIQITVLGDITDSFFIEGGDDKCNCDESYDEKGSDMENTSD